MEEQIAKMNEILAVLQKRKEWINNELKYVKEKEKKVKWMLNNLNQLEMDLDEVYERSQSGTEC